MNNQLTIRPETHKDYKDIVALIEKVKEMGFKGITVEDNFLFYNQVGFVTSSKHGIYPVSGWPMDDPRCQMCMEIYEGSLKDKGGYIVYDMYYNA